MISRRDVLQALRACHDPELGLDIVSLGLIYDVRVEPTAVHVLMTLTTPGCPLVPYFRQDIEAKVRQISQIDRVEITLTFDPPWNPAMMSPAARQQLTLLRG